jgi:hypothetical protein
MSSSRARDEFIRTRDKNFAVEYQYVIYVAKMYSTITSMTYFIGPRNSRPGRLTHHTHIYVIYIYISTGIKKRVLECYGSATSVTLLRLECYQNDVFLNNNS